MRGGNACKRATWGSALEGLAAHTVLPSLKRRGWVQTANSQRRRRNRQVWVGLWGSDLRICIFSLPLGFSLSARPNRPDCTADHRRIARRVRVAGAVSVSLDTSAHFLVHCATAKDGHESVQPAGHKVSGVATALAISTCELDSPAVPQYVCNGVGCVGGAPVPMGLCGGIM